MHFCSELWNLHLELLFKHALCLWLNKQIELPTWKDRDKKAALGWKDGKWSLFFQQMLSNGRAYSLVSGRWVEVWPLFDFIQVLWAGCNLDNCTWQFCLTLAHLPILLLFLQVYWCNRVVTAIGVAFSNYWIIYNAQVVFFFQCKMLYGYDTRLSLTDPS